MFDLVRLGEWVWIGGGEDGGKGGCIVWVRRELKKP